MSNTMTRRKKFRRDPSEERIILNETDDYILECLFRSRFLTTDQIRKITEAKSKQYLQRRVRQLFDHGYIDRHADVSNGGGSLPMVYGLGEEGINRLRDQNKVHLSSLKNWRKQQNDTKRYFKEHTIDTAEQLIHMELAARQHSSIEFLSSEYILKKGGAKTRRGAHPLSMKTSIGWDGAIHLTTVIPDGMFGLYTPAASDRYKFQFFMVELDEGTMPVISHNVRASSIVKKMKAYAAAVKGREHTKRFGMEAFRVIFITTSPERVANMQAAYEKHIKKNLAPGFLLFTTKAQLTQTNPLGPETVIQTASGKPFFFDPALQQKAA